MTLLPAIGSGWNPSIWCPGCKGVRRIEASCPCQADDAASIPYRVTRLLRERYPQPAAPSAMQLERWRL